MKISLKNLYKRFTGKTAGYSVGKLINLSGDDRAGITEVSTDMLPEKVDSMMQNANGGKISDLQKLAEELLEKNWTLRFTSGVRVAAVAKTPYEIIPASDSDTDKQIAADLAADLKNAGGPGLMSFKQLVNSMAMGFYTGVNVSEIVWKPGGRIAGFSRISGRLLTFENTYDKPELYDQASGLSSSLEFGNYIIHYGEQSLSGDPARAGIIRTIAWLHCFSGLNFKYLLRFIERYGMPFAFATVDRETFDKELDVIQELIRNFGPDGGGVFTTGTQMQLLQSASSGGDVYFKLQEYADAAVTRLVLGQTASSSEGGGLSKDNAQAAVRQDIREADCEIIGDTLNSQVFPYWTRFNYGDSAQPPKIKFNAAPPEDNKAKNDAAKTKVDAMCAAVNAMLLTPTLTVEKAIRQLLDLPVDDPDMSSNSNRAMPKTTSDSNGALSLSDTHKKSPSLLEDLPQNAMSEFLANGADEWASDFLKKSENLTDEAFLEFVTSTQGLKLFKNTTLSETLANTIYASIANGLATASDEIGEAK